MSGLNDRLQESDCRATRSACFGSIWVDLLSNRNTFGQLILCKVYFRTSFGFKSLKSPRSSLRKNQGFNPLSGQLMLTILDNL